MVFLRYKMVERPCLVQYHWCTSVIEVTFYQMCLIV